MPDEWKILYAVYVSEHNLEHSYCGDVLLIEEFHNKKNAFTFARAFATNHWVTIHKELWKKNENHVLYHYVRNSWMDPEFYIG